MTCEIDGCEKPGTRLANKWCEMHYMRDRRHGDPLQVQAITVGCSVEGCERKHAANGLCHTHDVRRQKWGDPSVVRRPRWNSPLGYSGVHQLLRAQRGSATKHPCVTCGGPAKQWAYLHTDPDQRESEWGPYSLDLEHYTAMCVPCHKRFDLARLRVSVTLDRTCSANPSEGTP